MLLTIIDNSNNHNNDNNQITDEITKIYILRVKRIMQLTTISKVKYPCEIQDWSRLFIYLLIYFNFLYYPTGSIDCATQ